MKIGIIVCLVISFQRTEPYAIRCPYSSEWNPRARVDCTSATHYMCLFNNIDHIYSESCDPKEYKSRIGRKILRSPGINEDDCSPDRYQPFKFTTRGNSDCVLDKSFCNEEGQVIANNGSTSTDRACRCDYTKGYVYVTTPESVCSCIPSDEDCRCYLKHCPVGQKLTADYSCIGTGQFVPQTCPEIRKSTDIYNSPYVYDTNNLYETVTYARNVAIAVLIITVINIVLLVMLYIKVQPYLERTAVKYQDALIVEICDDPYAYTVMPGDVLTIEWKVKSLFPVKSVICKKDGKDVKSTVMDKDGKEIKSVVCENDQERPKLDNDICENDQERNKLDTVVCENDQERNKLDTVVCENDQERNEYDNDKYTIKWSDDLMALSITINKFELGDAGTYTCKVTNVVNLTNTCADSCIDCLSCKRNIVGISKCMQYFPMFRLDVRNPVKLCVGNMPTEIQNVVVVIKDSMAKLEVPSMKNITYVKWFRSHNKNLTSISVANKYCGGSTSTPSLSIKKTELQDAGIYVCVILKENEKSSFRYSLKVMPEEKIYQKIMNHRKDSCFVKTSTVQKAFKSLCDHGLVIITGREGTGKSSMCLELASMCEEKDYLPFALDSQKCGQAKFVGTKMLYIIDNIRFDKENCDQLHKILSVLPCTEQRWIIITCRTSELLSLEDALQETNKFESKCLMDLDNNLLEEEKLQILTAYLEKNKSSNNEVLLDKESVRKIISSEPYYGFPFTAVQFSEDRKRQQLGAKYFTDPPKSVVDKIKGLYEHGQQDKNELCIKQFCVLVSIALKGYLDGSEDINSINKTTQILFCRQILTTSYDLIEAANSMVGMFVAQTGKHYIYVHRSLLKAVFLSSKYCANYLTEYGSIQDIEDCVRSCNYEPIEDELVFKLESKDEPPYHLLCERLIFEVHKDTSLTKEISRYLYTNFIKLRDITFVDVLVKHLTLLHFQDKTFRETHTQDIPYKVTEYISTWEIIVLLDGLTYNGTDPWFYYRKTLPNFIIQCGLIAACKWEYLKDVAREGTFKTLLITLKEKMGNEDFVESLFESIDEKGNTFFHYITLYCEAESCDILNAVDIILLKDDRKKFNRPNKMSVTPLQMAAYMGKLEMCKSLLAKTNVKKDILLQFVRDGMNYHFESKSSSVFNVQDNFVSNVLTSVLFGREQNYLSLLELFS